MFLRLFDMPIYEFLHKVNILEQSNDLWASGSMASDSEQPVLPGPKETTISEAALRTISPPVISKNQQKRLLKNKKYEESKDSRRLKRKQKKKELKLKRKNLVEQGAEDVLVFCKLQLTV